MKILGQYQSYTVNTKRCLLCLNEKLQIAIYQGDNFLKKRTEIISRCRHRNKYTLAIYDSMDWNIRYKVSWDYWKFCLWRSNLMYLGSRLTEASSASINSKFRCILCDVYTTHVFTIIHVNTFHLYIWNGFATNLILITTPQYHYLENWKTRQHFIYLQVFMKIKLKCLFSLYLHYF